MDDPKTGFIRIGVVDISSRMGNFAFDNWDTIGHTIELVITNRHRIKA